MVDQHGTIQHETLSTLRLVLRLLQCGLDLGAAPIRPRSEEKESKFPRRQPLPTLPRPPRGDRSLSCHNAPPPETGGGAPSCRLRGRLTHLGSPKLNRY